MSTTKKAPSKINGLLGDAKSARSFSEIARTFLASSSAQPTIVWALLIAAVPLSRVFSANFPSSAMVQSTIMLGLFLAIVAFGQGLVILSGGIDLSVPAAVSLGAFSTGFLATAGLPTIFAVLGGIGIASLVGLVNGLIISRTNFPPFIVTLAVSTIAAALLLGFSKGRPGQSAPLELVAIFNGNFTVLGIAPPVFILAVILIAGFLIQSRTTFGRKVYALGNSQAAARIAGVKVQRSVVFVYWVAGFSYGLAGVLLLGYGSGSDLNIGASWLLPSIAVVVVGGSSISGGTGSYVGTVAAALLLTLLSIDISAAGFPEGIKQVLYGAIILLALLLSKIGGSKR
jgi:ribose transport system permease protein